MKFCLTCKKIITSRKNSKYCSQECHYNAGKKHVKNICINCGKSFEKGQHDNSYCSRECYLNFMEKHRTFTCKKCNKIFIKKPGSKIRGNEKFCSIKCSSEYRKNKIELSCPICNKKFYRIPANIRKINCCSNSCANVIKMKNKTRISKKQIYVTEIFENILNEKANNEVIFSDLKYKGYLFVDAIFNKNNIALEYNGPHHYKEVGYSKVKLNEQIVKDDIKRNYLLNNGFTFIEWPYTIKITLQNVEKILSLISSQAYLKYIKVDEWVQRLGNEITSPRMPETL
jgi:hypothetical protein